MSSYRTEAVRPNRDPHNSRIPLQRRQHWTELPGWVTAYVREKTEIVRKDAQNAHVYDILCKLWQVTKSFGVASDQEEDSVVFLVSEATTSRDPNRPTSSINLPGLTLVKDVVHVIEFLVTNASNSYPKRLGWLNPNLHVELSHSDCKDWIIFPAPDMIQWLSNQVPRATERSLRHIPKSIPCKVAVFGNLNQTSLSQFSAASMRFAQVWHRGIFLTITSKAAAANHDSLKTLVSKMIERQYDHLGNPSGTRDPTQLVLWLSLHTYWLLSPPSTNETHSPEDINIPMIRAFNQILNPDLPAIPILNKDQVDKGIKNILNNGNTSIHLTEAEDMVQNLKIPRVQLNHYIKAMVNIYGDRLDRNHDEIHSIIEIGSLLVKTFWLSRINLVVVDDLEFTQLNQIQSPCCQFITFETLFRFMSNDFLD